MSEITDYGVEINLSSREAFLLIDLLTAVKIGIDSGSLNVGTSDYSRNIISFNRDLLKKLEQEVNNET